MRAQTQRHENGAYERTVRASISFPEDQYQVLERIEAENKVSFAWIVRDAINGNLKSKWPPLPQGIQVEDSQQRSERS